MKRYLRILLFLLPILLFGAACSRVQPQTKIINDKPIIQSIPQIDETTNWKIYKTEVGFEFKYPANWYNDGQYFSPQKIEYYEIGSVNAPVYYTLLSINEFNSSNLKYEIANNKRNKPDSIIKIAGKDFKKYDLVDYGRYEGGSAGRVLIFLSPELSIGGVNYYLAFHWEEKPALKTIQNNDPTIFEKIISTLTFVSQSDNGNISPRLLFPFLKDGDVFIYDSFLGEQRITHHPDVTFSARRYSLGGYMGDCEGEECNTQPPVTIQPIEQKDYLNEDYHTLVRLSPNKDVLVYSCLSEETLKLIKDRQLLASSAIPDLDPLSDFLSGYDLCFYNLNSKKVDIVKVGISRMLDFDWSADGNSLALLWLWCSHGLDESCSGFGNAGAGIYILKKSGSIYEILSNLPYPQLPSPNMAISPDGSKVFINWQGGRYPDGERNQDLFILNSSGKEGPFGPFVFGENNGPLFDLIFGDWLDDHNVLLGNVENGVINAYLRGIDSESKIYKQPLFIENDTNYSRAGDTWFEYSPSKNYVTYTLYPNNQTQLIVRNLQTQERIVVTDFLPKPPEGFNRSIMQKLWSNDDTLIFDTNLFDKKSGKTEIWVWNANKKLVTKLFEGGKLGVWY
ncbi:MAG: hypothetical protein V1712_03170 [Patescibacteria group bacterium]